MRWPLKGSGAKVPERHLDLALFDLDNTLLSGDSDYEWAQFLIDQGAVERAGYEARNNEFYQRYKDGTLDIYEFLDFQLAPLAIHTRAQLDAWHAAFMEQRIRPMMRKKGRELIDRHLANGDLCAVVTATNAFVTAPIVREFGVPHLLATDIEVVAGRFTGRPAGVPCFREGKVTRLEAWLRERRQPIESFGTSWFYSDSHNDVPVLERVARAVAVDPDERLRALATGRGWPIISLQ